MCPLFGEFALTVNEMLKLLAIISAQSGPEHQELCGHQYVDVIELQQAQCADYTAKVTGVDPPRWPATVKSLGSETNSPRLRE